MFTTNNPSCTKDLNFGEVWVCSGQSNMEFNMFGIFDAENEMDLSAAYTEVHIATFLSFGMNVMQVKFTKVNKVTAGQEMRDLWGGLSIPWSRCKCHRGISWRNTLNIFAAHRTKQCSICSLLSASYMADHYMTT